MNISNIEHEQNIREIQQNHQASKNQLNLISFSFLLFKETLKILPFTAYLLIGMVETSLNHLMTLHDTISEILSFRDTKFPSSSAEMLTPIYLPQTITYKSIRMSIAKKVSSLLDDRLLSMEASTERAQLKVTNLNQIGGRRMTKGCNSINAATIHQNAAFIQNEGEHLFALRKVDGVVKIHSMSKNISFNDKAKTSYPMEKKSTPVPRIEGKPQYNKKPASKGNLTDALYGIGDKTSPVMISEEHVDGVPLVKLINSHSLSTEEALLLFRDIVNTVTSFHNHGKIHRDLNPNNIIIMPNGKVKIIDFGAAGEKGDSIAYKMLNKQFFIIGTPSYIAPESFFWGEDGSLLNEKVDAFSLGVILINLFKGFEENKNFNHSYSFPFKEKFYAYSNFENIPNISKLVNSLIKIDPTERIGCDEALFITDSILDSLIKTKNNEKAVSPIDAYNPLNNTQLYLQKIA
ncbi:hypothetical protein A2526_03475 [candidate division WOR-1 bacterium RIFOXYD2_FULL_36_8]|uniref:Protein kinase domain-containing protein n=1 Tax=candidate division WOR-1 bacterium RIFOXYB2_FULL_36_35 TaxID=1802578 RepID=A0A1F4S277_UNCSA|nr:MAG: hypothetical protein A2230_04015 [candidate division WOR-1 bacterium RIFOXYA2_FULL_36_21]OGC14531.1 MAG: hypothetical protein A2290_00030 [candidate division WOR-1 bacterium RIFOXYB2_FULL_36_35]OGC16891.1 MAG: hypothetical protein A2282_08550 [candidate division WOR-1 bacterium RIFOXYA12_FULL_36_13]OGC39189.1 MAG: hypothetical protein A2526_03475 [candidate division WOR-1 bacterium RIFOXYD2_FULL_36_8]